MVFIVNDVIKLKDNEKLKCERILWKNDNNGYCYTIQLDTTKINITLRQMEDLMIDLQNEVIELVNDEYGPDLMLEEDMGDENKQKRDEAYEIVKYVFADVEEPHIFDRAYRGKAVNNGAIHFNVSKVVIYKYLRLFWQGGKLKNSLIPQFNKCGGKGKKRIYTAKPGRRTYESYLTGENIGITIDSEIEKIFDLSIKRYYNESQEVSFSKTYDYMINDFFTQIIDGEKKVQDRSTTPSVRQFRYWYDKNISLEESIKSRIGDRKFNLNYRALNSNSTSEAFAPGFRYQIDATVADIYLVNRIDRKSIIGRPILYLVVDVFSRLITGIYVGLEGPSWSGASSAIYNCYENKVEFCKKFNIEIKDEDWPAHGLPQVLLGDRGELVGPIGEPVIENLKINFENAPTGRGDAKGIVEQNFRVINTKIKNWSPGFVKKEFRERGERDYRLDATLDIFDFTKIIIYSVLNRNKNYLETYPLTQEMINDGINPIPVEIWNWGILNKTGKLRSVPDDFLKLWLMRKGKASITERGVVFKNALYSSDDIKNEGWLVYARIKGTKLVDIVFDSRDLSIIYIFDKKDNKFLTCYLKNENEIFMNKTYEELCDFNFMRRAGKMGLTNKLNQNNVDFNTAAKEIVKEAQERAKERTINQSNKKRISNIKENRNEEKHTYGEAQAFSFVQSNNFINNGNVNIVEEVKLGSDKKAEEIIKKLKGGKVVSE